MDNIEHVYHVRMNMYDEIVICKDRENRNNLDNMLLRSVLSTIEKTTIMINIKTEGKQNAELTGKKIFLILEKYDHVFYLCSTNEYAIAECIEHRNFFSAKDIKIGVISFNIPIGMYTHIDIDFICIQYDIIHEEFIKDFEVRNIAVISWIELGSFIPLHSYKDEVKKIKSIIKNIYQIKQFIVSSI